MQIAQGYFCYEEGYFEINIVIIVIWQIEQISVFFYWWIRHRIFNNPL
jgi:hypothetical protein